ncbi:MAG: glycosyl transferase [Rhodospirillaceae bacterium]|mgnify:CR=1 FL=1|nr:glycosyl transferase [Rhodospirillaceae bacterium]|tara:strand:+ start:12396 stop:13604 length:1209 start_codon:yes stop_codon:yes gene_type:complete
MAEQLSTTVATISRFHSFEVALQLQSRQALHSIYSGLARRFLRRYPVDPAALRTFPWYQTPLEAAPRLKLLTPAQSMRLEWLAKTALDRHIARTLPDCHVFMALSGIGLAAGKAAQDRNIAYICDRSSSHIAFQNELLRNEYEMLGMPYQPISERMIEREQQEYEQADAIVLPSGFAERSFVEKGYDPDRLHRISFGVNLSSFKRVCDRDEDFTVLFVGSPGVQKGFHYLLQAFNRADLPGATLRIVGNPLRETKVLLEKFPVEGIEILGPQFQPEVVRHMSRANVLVLPSIQEGMALVQAEAMACGCPVIASTSTGSEDLFTNGEEGFILAPGDVEGLAARLVKLYDDRHLGEEMGAKGVRQAQNIGGWDGYGDRLIALCLELARTRGHDVYSAERVSAAS